MADTEIKPSPKDDKKAEQLSAAGKQLDDAKKELENANKAQEKIQKDLDAIKALQKDTQDRAALSERLEEDKKEQEKYLARKKEIEEKFLAFQQETDKKKAALKEEEARLNKINGILKRTNLKSETRTKWETNKTSAEQKIDKLTQELEEPAEELTIFKTAIDSAKSTINDITSDIDKTQKTIDDIPPKEELEERKKTATKNLEEAKTKVADATKNLFTAQNVFAKLQGVNWGKAALNVTTSVIITGLASTALTPTLGVAALFAVPAISSIVISVFSAPILAIIKNRGLGIPWRKSASNSLWKTPLKQVFAKAVTAAVIGGITGNLFNYFGINPSDYFPNSVKNILGISSNVEVITPPETITPPEANTSTTTGNTNTPVAPVAEPPPMVNPTPVIDTGLSAVFDGSILDISDWLNGIGSDDQNLALKAAAEALRAGVDPDLVAKAIESTTTGNFLDSSSSADMIMERAEKIISFKADGVFTVGENKDTLTSLMKSLSEHNFVNKDVAVEAGKKTAALAHQQLALAA